MRSEKKDASLYKELSTEMRQGLRDIYQQITTVSAGESPNAGALFSEASDQLDEVLKTTEAAAMSIMGIIEKQLELQEERVNLLAELREQPSRTKLGRLNALNSELGEDLLTLLSTLSFQDITGQRIKKVMTALNAIESQVLELYLASGLVMDGAEKDPAKDAATLKDEARKAMEDFRENRKVQSKLKGPDKNAISQSAIDDMLSQLGL